MNYKQIELFPVAAPTALFLFNHSAYAFQAWLDAGYNVVSVDYDETDHSGYHSYNIDGEPANLFRLNIDLTRGDAKEVILGELVRLGLESPSFCLSFVPCTDMAVSGAAHFASKKLANAEFQTRWLAPAQLAGAFGCPYVVENPVSVLSTMWRKPDHVFNPCDYAGYCPEGPHPEFSEYVPVQDRYNKKTCYWTGNGFVMPERKRLEPLTGEFHGHTKLGGKSARTKYIRSLTPRGISNAMFESNGKGM